MAHRKALAALSLVAVAGLAVLTPSTADARPRGRFRGGVVIGGFYDPFYVSPFYSPFGFGYGYGRSLDTSGSARIQVTPKEAEVYVDGYRAGRVDDFDGTFQRLNVRPGPHEITLYLPGYRTLTERVYIGEGSTMKLKQSLEKLAPGETSTPPPAPPREERRARGRRTDGGDDRDDR